VGRNKLRVPQFFFYVSIPRTHHHGGGVSHPRTLPQFQFPQNRIEGYDERLVKSLDGGTTGAEPRFLSRDNTGLHA